MTFEERLAVRARAVESRLSELLDMQCRTGGSVPARLDGALRHAVLAGGKRIRPFLVIESAALFGVPDSKAMPAAIALELIHCYSLVLDDLRAMDNDELRRGRPSVWKAYD